MKKGLGLTGFGIHGRGVLKSVSGDVEGQLCTHICPGLFLSMVRYIEKELEGLETFTFTLHTSLFGFLGG